MFYRWFRGLLSWALAGFFRLEPLVDPTGGLALPGPVIFVGNHPNGLIDPGLLFILVRRPITFMAKAPLFGMPLLGAILKALDALPVYRQQDNPGDMARNEGTLTAAIQALVQGRAITLFPEGKSHSEPQLAALKTGCARIALEAVRQGAPVRIVPVGLVYEDKRLFRSRVHVEVGAPLTVADFRAVDGEDPHQAARRLTTAIADGLRAVTLNLGQWEDLPVLETAQQLYALEKHDQASELERRKAFARGLALLREEQPARLEALKSELASYRQRLDLLQVTPDDLDSQWRPGTVARFVVRNLAWLLTLPLFLVGWSLFILPYLVPLAVARGAQADPDLESTLKFLTALLLAPLWWVVLVALGFWQGGLTLGLGALLLVPPLALFTMVFYERRLAAWHDVQVFFLFWSKRRLQARLLDEGRALARQVVSVADELGPRVA